MWHQPPGTDVCFTFKFSLMRGRFRQGFGDFLGLLWEGHSTSQAMSWGRSYPPQVKFFLISQEQQRRVESEEEKANNEKNRGRTRTETGRKWFRLISSCLHRHAVMSFIRPESRPNDYNTFPYIGSWPKTQSNKRGPRMQPIQTPQASLATAHDTFFFFWKTARSAAKSFKEGKQG